MVFLFLSVLALAHVDIIVEEDVLLIVPPQTHGLSMDSKLYWNSWCLQPFLGFLFSSNSFIEKSTYHTIYQFKVYNSMVFSIFMGWYNYHLTPIIERLCSPETRSPLH